MNFAEMGIEVKSNGPQEQRPRCAQCDKKGPFSVNVVSGMFQCFSCGWKGRAGNGALEGAHRSITRFDDPSVAERKRERLRKTWRETISINHVNAYPVRAYLDSRFLVDFVWNPPANLRAHPGLAYWEGNKLLGTYPAMVALFSSADGTPTTLHVTYLRVDGSAKAGVPAPKKILGVPVKGATKGGAIRLFSPKDGVLGVAEGIENALSLYLLKDIPVWASFCADNLARLEMPTGLKALYIGVDVDKSGKGESVAQALANRVLRKERNAEVFFVKPEGAAPCDLNDELVRTLTP